MPIVQIDELSPSHTVPTKPKPKPKPKPTFPPLPQGPPKKSFGLEFWARREGSGKVVHQRQPDSELRLAGFGGDMPWVTLRRIRDQLLVISVLARCMEAC